MTDGIYFDRSTFGVDRVLANPILGDIEGKEMKSVVARMPISEQDQAEFIRLVEGGVDYLAGMTLQEKTKLLRNTSYLDFLKEYAGMPEAVTVILQDTFLYWSGVGWEADSALEATKNEFPGTWELGVHKEDEEKEPYIFHFPDGNASVARLLVRDLLPNTIPGSTMEDIVTARADYSLLDTDASDIRIRLNSTVVHAANTPDGKFVDITYVNNGDIYRARARHVVLACYNNMIPYICPEIPEQQAEAIRYASKVPYVIGSIAIRNWRAFVEAGFDDVYSPGDVYFNMMFLDYPVSMGDYQYSKNPDEPVVISGWFSPTARGLPAKEQYRKGRETLMQMSYDDFEQDIYSHLDGMLGSYGFDAEREIAAITLNRWSHGYAYEFEGIGVPAEYDRYNGPHIAGRAQIGRISIANSDSEARAYADGAIDAADRAVNEQLGR